MSKKKPTGANGKSSGPSNDGGNVTDYFRQVFAENPTWLDTRSNDALFARWLKDHPGETEVPEPVRKNLSNVKSVLRSQSRKADVPKKPGRSKKDTLATQHSPDAARESGRKLDTLEEQIDECLTLAKNLDRDGLEDVINLLRRARNEVVWKMGETLDR